VGMHMDNTKSIYRYDEYAIYHIAQLCSDNKEMFIHPKLTLLLNLDKEHDSSFTQSLYTYLKCNRNITDTANALHIHRNTLIYHLKRIEDLLDISTSDVDILLHFELSFRIMEYTKTKHIFPMHFWNRYEIIRKFLEKYPEEKERVIQIEKQGQVFEWN